jgi:hypothetical protein
LAALPPEFGANFSISGVNVEVRVHGEELAEVTAGLRRMPTLGAG